MIRVFTSFDFDHDEDIRTLLVNQSKFPDTPFEMADWSVREPFTGNWVDKVQARIRQVDQVIVLCGEYTHTAVGVDYEVQIARAERKPYFLLWGRRDKQCTKPKSAANETIYKWEWDNIKKLLAGHRYNGK